MNILERWADRAKTALNKAWTLSKSVLAGISGIKGAVFWALLTASNLAIAEDASRGNKNGYTSFWGGEISAKSTARYEAQIAQARDAIENWLSLSNNSENSESGNNEINDIEKIEENNPDSSILIWDKVYNLPNSVFKIYNESGEEGKEQYTAHTSYETNSGEPLYSIYIPLETMLSSIAEKNWLSVSDLSTNFLDWTWYRIWKNTGLAWVKFKIEWDRVETQGILTTNLNTSLSVVDKNSWEEIWIINLAIEWTDYDESYTAPENYTHEINWFSQSRVVSRVTNSETWEREIVIWPSYTDENWEKSKGYDLTSILEKEFINPDTVESLHPAYRVVVGENWEYTIIYVGWYNPEKNSTRIDYEEGEKIIQNVNDSNAWFPNKDRVAFVPIKVVWEDDSIRIINLEVNTSASIEAEQDQVIVNVWVEENQTTYINWVKIYRNDDNSTLELTFWESFEKQIWLKSNTWSYNSYWFNDNKLTKPYLEGFDWCDYDTENVWRRGTIQYETTIICDISDKSEWDTVNISWIFNFVPNALFTSWTTQWQKVSTNFTVELEKFDNTVQVVPDSNNVSEVINPTSETVTLRYSVSNDSYFTDENPAEGVSCTKSIDGNTAIVTLNILDLIRNNSNITDNNISFSCGLVNYKWGSATIEKTLPIIFSNQSPLIYDAWEVNADTNLRLDLWTFVTDWWANFYTPFASIPTGHTLIVDDNWVITTYYPGDLPIIPNWAWLTLEINSGSEEWVQKATLDGVYDVEFEVETLEKLNFNVNCKVWESCSSEILEVTNLWGKNIYVNWTELQDPIYQITITHPNWSTTRVAKWQNIDVKLNEWDKVQLNMLSWIPVSASNISIWTDSIINLNYSIESISQTRFINLPTFSAVWGEFRGVSTEAIAKIEYAPWENPHNTTFRVYRIVNGTKVYPDDFIVYQSVISNSSEYDKHWTSASIHIRSTWYYLSPGLTSLDSEEFQLWIEAVNTQAWINYDSLAQTEDTVEVKLTVTWEAEVAPEILSWQINWVSWALELWTSYTATIEFNGGLIPNWDFGIDNFIKLIQIKASLWGSVIWTVESYTVNPTDPTKVDVTFSIAQAPMWGFWKIEISTWNIAEFWVWFAEEDKNRKTSAMNISVRWL